jgi:hypothetical protein
MRLRTAVSSPPSWRRFDIDALAIPLSLPTLVPYSTTMSAWKGKEKFTPADASFHSPLRLKGVVPSGTNARTKSREETKELNNED